MNQQEAIAIIERSEKLPFQLKNFVKEELCGKWSKSFPISRYCTYTEVIKQKQAAFQKHIVQNIVSGNEVIIKIFVRTFK